MNSTSITRQSLSIADSNSQSVPIGLDCGNGQLKLVSSMGETRMDSYICYQTSRPEQTRSYVEYIGGSRQDLEGKAWVAGDDAYYFSPTQLYRVTDTPKGKSELCLQILLSAIAAKQTWRDSWDLYVVASVHDGEALGKSVRRALEGEHRIWANGRHSQIRITVAGVLEEGAGAIIHYSRNINTTNAIVYDLGNGTIITSSFRGLAMTNRNYSSNGGVEGLIDAIAASPAIRKKLLREGDRHVIRKGIEARDFRYGRYDWTFTDAYKDELPQWADRVLGPMVRATAERRTTASALIAIGGGSMLPGIAAMLAKRDIQVLQEPLWANARGLYQYATRQLARGGN